MSRTVRDLVDALRVDEERSFDPEAVWQASLRRARQHTLRRRAALALATGVAAAAAIAAPTVVLTGAPRPDPVLPGQSGSVTAAPSLPNTATPAPTVPSTRAALSVTLRAAPSDRWVVVPSSTNAYVQHAYVRRIDETKMLGSIEVYEPGVFDPSPIRGGTQTTVDGEPAFFGWLPDPFHTTRETRRTLAWQYALDAWVAVRIEHDTPTPSMSPEIPTELLEIASLVEIGDPEPVRLPFRVGYHPSTMVPVYVRHFEASWLNRVVGYEFSDSQTDYLVSTRSLSLPLEIAMQPAVAGSWQPNAMIAGQPAMYSGTKATFAVGEQWVEIGAGPDSAPLTVEEIAQIFSGLTFADWNDQSTWFDANTAT